MEMEEGYGRLEKEARGDLVGPLAEGEDCEEASQSQRLKDESPNR